MTMKLPRTEILELDRSLTRNQLRIQAALSKRELLRNWPDFDPASQPGSLSPGSQGGQSPIFARLRRLNLVGLGFGLKETSGRLTSALAVRVYVARKLPKNGLIRRLRIPEFVNGVPTDVIAVGNFEFQSRPVALGSSISHFNGGTGSMGCIVTVPGAEDWFLLSACHVLAPKPNATAGDEILEPAASAGGTSPIALLTDFESLQADGAANAYDAAIARVINKADIHPQLPRIGAVTTEVMEPVLYQSVRKYGAATLHTVGVVTDVSADTSFRFDGENYFFQDVVQVTGCGGDFSEGGDSGALVVDALSNRPVALLIGGAGTRSFASPLGRILNRFSASIV